MTCRDWRWTRFPRSRSRVNSVAPSERPAIGGTGSLPDAGRGASRAPVRRSLPLRIPRRDHEDGLLPVALSIGLANGRYRRSHPTRTDVAFVDVSGPIGYRNSRSPLIVAASLHRRVALPWKAKASGMLGSGRLGETPAPRYRLMVKEMAPDERLREGLRLRDPQSLSDGDLLAIILNTGASGTNWAGAGGPPPDRRRPPGAGGGLPEARPPDSGSGRRESAGAGLLHRAWRVCTRRSARLGTARRVPPVRTLPARPVYGVKSRS